MGKRKSREIYQIIKYKLKVVFDFDNISTYVKDSLTKGEGVQRANNSGYVENNPTQDGLHVPEGAQERRRGQAVFSEQQRRNNQDLIC